MELTESAQLALDTILQKPAKGIPSWFLNVMEHDHIDRIAGVPPGTYRQKPEQTYIAMQRNLGTCLLDQYIWSNPLTISSGGFQDAQHGATTGAEQIVLDGIAIDSPEAVAEHLETIAFPRLKRQTASFDEDAEVRRIIESERAIQEKLGPTILKSGYGFAGFPGFAYGTYGYVNYFSAYALYPDIVGRHFKLQADYWSVCNKAAARAFAEGGIPPLLRLDHDMADSRGTLASIESLDKMWFPHFARAIEPLLKADVRLIWHCDGNLMQMVPRLLDCGLRGFQGFQYEDGMDYERICRMKTRDGEGLIIIAGVSVTRTLPMGTPSDVKREMQFLVERGPSTGLFLGASSSIAPGVPWENMKMLWEGLLHYGKRSRG